LKKKHLSGIKEDLCAQYNLGIYQVGIRINKDDKNLLNEWYLKSIEALKVNIYTHNIN
jgi:hypothetical protein